MAGIYEAGLLLSVRFLNAECDLLPMRISYTENKSLHQNILVNELTSQCVHTYKRHAVSR